MNRELRTMLNLVLLGVFIGRLYTELYARFRPTAPRAPLTARRQRYIGHPSSRA